MKLTTADITLGVIAIASLGVVGMAELNSKSLSYKTMRITVESLSKLNDIESFNTLYLNQKYDPNWVLERDESSLTASAWSENLERQIPLKDISDPFIEPFEDEETKLSCNIFSNFILTRESIEYLTHVEGAHYIVFRPGLYAEDENYVSFTVMGYTRDMQPIELEGRYATLNPCPPARPY